MAAYKCSCIAFKLLNFKSYSTIPESVRDVASFSISAVATIMQYSCIVLSMQDYISLGKTFLLHFQIICILSNYPSTNLKKKKKSLFCTICWHICFGVFASMDMFVGGFFMFMFLAISVWSIPITLYGFLLHTVLIYSVSSSGCSIQTRLPPYFYEKQLQIHSNIITHMMLVSENRLTKICITGK